MTLACAPDQDIIIVGATGDLARRKLLPAIYNLEVNGLLPDKGRIIGTGRSPLSNDDFRKLAGDAIGEFSRSGRDEAAWRRLASRLVYVPSKDGYSGVKSLCELPNRLVYLSIPPDAFEATIEAVAEGGLVEGSRLIVEKPFGHDLASSRHLAEVMHAHFDEDQVFRIDHYLGKETVQNILVFRFGNAVFERIWNRDMIEHVQFTVAESIGIEGRGAFYEETGALRDILQNHAFQVLSLLTMEPPASFAQELVRDEKMKVFESMRPLHPDDVVRGQYTAGEVENRTVPGYLEEEGVESDSQTETFAAMRLFIDNWRWAGVPFYLRTGKRMSRHVTEATIVFRQAPVRFFQPFGVEELAPNTLTIGIQPEECITLKFMAKEPGPDVTVEPVNMTFSYDSAFKVQPAEAYERLLHDALCGDHTLFARADGVDRAWQVVQPVLDNMPPAQPYVAGTWGPRDSEDLIAPRKWHLRAAEGG